MLPVLKKYQTGDAKIDKLQEGISQQFTLINAPFINGKFLTTTTNSIDTDLIPLTTTATNFEHKLGREPAGFLVTYQDANAVIWWDRTSSEDRSFFLRLDASASVNVKIWIW